MNNFFIKFKFFIKYLIFIFIILITPNVFAKTQDVTNKIKGLTSMPSGTYTGYAPSSLAVPIYNYETGTRYNGTLARIEFYLNGSDWDWEYNKNYTITLSMATEDWRNHFMGPQVFRANNDGSLWGTNNSNMATSGVTFVSQKKIKFNFRTSSSGNMGTYTYFHIYSTNYKTTAFTGVSNWNLSSVIITDNTSSTPTPAPVTPSPTPTPQPNNQDIINNNTQNTQDIINNNNTNTDNIINNQNQNTNDLIDNSNQNTQDIINNQNENANKTNDLLGNCVRNIFNVFDYDYSSSRYSIEERQNQYAIILTANGNYTGGTFPLTYHLILKPNTTYYFKKGNSDVVGTARLNYYVYRDSPSGTLVTYTNDNTDFYFTTPITDYKDYYIRIYVTGTQTSGDKVVIQRPMLFEKNNLVIPPGMYNSFYLPYNEEKCTSKLDDTNAYLTDDSDPTMENSELNGLFSSMHFNDPLGYLLTLPTTLINTLVSQSNVCQVVNLGTLWNVPITLPCIDIGSIIGESVWNIIDVLFSIGLLVTIFKNLYHTFANLLTLGAEKQARESFNMPTPMDFLSMILGGGRD